MADRRASVSGTLAEAAYVALLPVALFLAYEVSPINQAGFLDPWLYTGFINNFEDLVARYGLTYYSVRFGLIFPHYILAQVFGPVAGYLTFCYLMYLLAGVPLYLLFRKSYSLEAATFAYALLVSSAWFARTVLWTPSAPTNRSTSPWRACGSGTSRSKTRSTPTLRARS